ncbi:MAG: PEP-CTERM system histidine kinase PrsK [Nitrospirae bacterium]|nr:PEP-CTERM system histidine kinase PrsK [Nitrospirota bacterium]
MAALSIVTFIISSIVALAVLFKKHKQLSLVVFSLGLFATAFVTLGDALSILSPAWFSLWKKAVFIVESLMAPVWLLFTMSYARSDYRRVTGRFSKLLLFLSPLFVLIIFIVPEEAFFYSPEFESERVLFLGNAGYIFNILLLLYSVVSIANLEATLRSSSGVSRWQIKYAMLGVFGILAANIFYYSHALLYRSINMNLLPVRTGVLLISSLLIGFSILRHKFMDVEVTVSRNVFYKSLSIIIIGFYLLGLGLIGEGMRYLGPKAGRNITTFLGFLGAIAIMAVILSEQLRKKAMVFINKNFYSQKYDYRTQWLQFTQRISSRRSFDELLDSLTEEFKEAIGVRGASIWLKGRSSGEYICARLSEAPNVSIKPPGELIEFLNSKRWVFNINDKRCKGIAVSSAEFIAKTKASLIIPLFMAEDLLGFVILMEGLANNDYNFEDYDLLRTLANQAAASIMNARLSEELLEAGEVEAMGRLSSFIIHDLKNTASMLSMIAQNAEEHIDNPDFQRDAVKSVANTAEKINGLIQKLKNLPSKVTLNLQYSDLSDSIKEAIKELKVNGKTGLFYEGRGPVMARFDKEEIKKVILNLVLNALDATSVEGNIKITLGTEGGRGIVCVSDNGQGMSKEFMETRLFKPFQTTKKKGLGIGLYQCKAIIDAHGGEMRVKSEEGRGTDFFIYLPLEV